MGLEHGRVYDERVGEIVFVVRETAVLVTVGLGLDEAVRVRRAQRSLTCKNNGHNDVSGVQLVTERSIIEFFQLGVNYWEAGCPDSANHPSEVEG